MFFVHHQVSCFRFVYQRKSKNLRQENSEQILRINRKKIRKPDRNNKKLIASLFKNVENYEKLAA